MLSAFFVTTALSASAKTAIELFGCGVVAAMNLYCGTKLPRNKRSKT
jgi:hypothetical protein